MVLFFSRSIFLNEPLLSLQVPSQSNFEVKRQNEYILWKKRGEWWWWWWWGNNVAIVTRLDWNVRGLMSGQVLGNSGTRGIKNVPLMKPLEMMIETLMLGTCWLGLRGNWATNYTQWIVTLNNMRLPSWEYPVWAGLELCSFVSTKHKQRHQEHLMSRDILHPLSLLACAHNAHLYF